jgi:cytochrome c oxidase assembly protein subunit 15
MTFSPMTFSEDLERFPGRRMIGIWLLICCAMIFAMVVLGGVTRLSGSGLSMVDWKPVYGVLPPMSQTEWLEVFEMYKATPEYHKVNVRMDVEGFKEIFWLEYFHRILGRLIGVVFLLPFLFFLFTRRIARPLVPKLVILFVLGGLQGLLGWYMVKSGLVNNPHVSQYRLTAHLMLALLIYGYMLWIAYGLITRHYEHMNVDRLKGLRKLTYLVLGLVVITLASGGFVAGLKAGLAYNTFPLMDGRWIPEGLFTLQPWFLNLFENMATVQFNHRALASALFLMIVVLWAVSLHYQLPRGVRMGMHLLLLVGIAQVSLGITTLVYQVPIPLAAAHQGGALVVFTVILYLTHRLYGIGLRAG